MKIESSFKSQTRLPKKTAWNASSMYRTIFTNAAANTRRLVQWAPSRSKRLRILSAERLAGCLQVAGAAKGGN
jgi:hypothetical protein